MLLDAAGNLAHRTLSIPLARCGRCGRRCRVLPEELLPRKTFGLGPIKRLLDAYLPHGPGLRSVVGAQGGDSPHPSTLWHWLQHLGTRVLDRTPPADRFLPRMAAIVEETARRLDDTLPALWHETLAVSREKHRSEARRERLVACLRLVRAAARLFSEVALTLVHWQHFLIRTFHVPALAFSCRDGGPPIQHRNRRSPRVGSRSRTHSGRDPP